MANGDGLFSRDRKRKRRGAIFGDAPPIQLINESKKGDDEGSVDKLRELLAYVDVNYQDADGWTALHHAGFIDWEEGVSEILSHNPDLTVEDNRGWTALDVTGARGKINSEQIIAGFGAPDLVSGDTRKSTVEIFKLATKTEAPELTAQFEKYYEDLYLFPEFRDIMDVVALDARGNRGDLAFRCFAANEAVTANIGPGMGTGSCDPKTHILTLGGTRDPRKADGDTGAGLNKYDLVRGTLIHELCHAAAFIVYQNWSLPYGAHENEKETRYREAIKDTARKAHLFMDKQGDSQGTGEKKLFEQFCGRISAYAKGHPLKKDVVLTMVEHIVSVAQGICLFGNREVYKHVPRLYEYFKEVFVADCKNWADNHGAGRYLDNGAWKGKARNLQDSRISEGVMLEVMSRPMIERKVPMDFLNDPADMTRRVEMDIRAHLADPQPPVDDIIAGNCLYWEVSDPQRGEIKKVKNSLPDMLTSAFRKYRSDLMRHQEIPCDKGRVLITRLSQLCHNGVRGDDGVVQVPSESQVKNVVKSWAKSL